MSSTLEKCEKKKKRKEKKRKEKKRKEKKRKETKRKEKKRKIQAICWRVDLRYYFNRASDVEYVQTIFKIHLPVLRCLSCTLTFIGV